MALPATLDPASPLNTDSPGNAAQEFRNLKQYLIDVFGLPSASAVTAAAFAITTAGVVTVSQGQSILHQGTITTDTPAIDITSTWNNGSVTFTAIKADITNTASGGSSKLIDLKVGGTSKFYVDVNGSLVATAITQTGALSLTGDMTIANGINIAMVAGTGSKIGTAATQKLGLWGVTPVVQPADGDQADQGAMTASAVGDLGATNGGWGYSSEANADLVHTTIDQLVADVTALDTLLTAMRTALVDMGAMKGSA